MPSITSKWAKNLRYKKILYKHSQILPPDDAKQGLQKLDGFFSVKFLMLVNFDMKNQNF
jgi:hypothetical protein